MNFKDYLEQHKELSTIYVCYTQIQGGLEETTIFENLSDAIYERDYMISVNSYMPWSYHQIYELDVNKAIEHIEKYGDCGTVSIYDTVEFKKDIFNYDFAAELDEYTVDIRNGKIYE